MVATVRAALGARPAAPARRQRHAGRVPQALRILDRWRSTTSTSSSSPCATTRSASSPRCGARLPMPSARTRGCGARPTRTRASARARPTCTASARTGSAPIGAFHRLAHVAQLEGLQVCKHTHGELGLAAAACQHVLLTLPNIVEGHQQTAQMMVHDVLTEPLPIATAPTLGCARRRRARRRGRPRRGARRGPALRARGAVPALPARAAGPGGARVAAHRSQPTAGGLAARGSGRRRTRLGERCAASALLALVPLLAAGCAFSRDELVPPGEGFDTAHSTFTPGDPAELRRVPALLARREVRAVGAGHHPRPVSGLASDQPPLRALPPERRRRAALLAARLDPDPAALRPASTRSRTMAPGRSSASAARRSAAGRTCAVLFTDRVQIKVSRTPAPTPTAASASSRRSASANAVGPQVGPGDPLPPASLAVLAARCRAPCRPGRPGRGSSARLRACPIRGV